MKLSVIVVNYNTKDLTVSCLKSLEKFPFKENFEVIVVDNGSSDGSARKISKLRIKNYSLKLIENNKNVGFAKGNNVGIKKAEGEYILLLNSDTKVLKNSLNDLVEFAERNSDAGAVVPKLLNKDKTLQASVFRLPTLFRTIRQYWLGETGLVDKYIPDGQKAVKVEGAVMAAFLITPKARKKAGLLNENYFMFFEDLDYCRELKRAGLGVFYLPEVKVVHLHGKSGEKISENKNQWKRLIPGSKTYHGELIHYARWFVTRVSQSPEIFVLTLAILGALFVRFLHFPDNIYFAYDQARDAFMAQEILAGDIKLIGPPASIAGLFHGPLYWYLIAPLYLVSSGSVVFVAGALRAFNALSVILVYMIGKTLAGKRTGLVAAFIFAFSFENWQEAQYFTNPGPAVVTSLLFYYGLARIAVGKGKLVDWLLLSLGFGLSIQLQFYMVYLVVPLLLTKLLFHKNILKNTSSKKMLVFISGLAITLATFIISEARFGFRALKGLVSMLGGGQKAEFGFFEKFSQWVDKVALTVNDSLGLSVFNFPRALLILAFLAIIVATYSKVNIKIKRSLRLLAIWIASTSALYLIAGHNTYYIIGMSALLILLFAVAIDAMVAKSYQKFIVLAVVAMSLFSIFKQAQRGIIVQISVQEGMRYGDEKGVVDYVYSDSKGGEFVLSAFTMPYDIYTTWAYMFQNYGSWKYGKTAYWVKEQVGGFPGSLPVPDKTVCNRYTIYESARGLERLEPVFRQEQDITTELVTTVSIGEFTVEKRLDKACK